MCSTFFTTGSLTKQGDLASLHLSRDQQLPVILSTVASKAEDQGYAEGVVTNTKFGSFPHSTLINIPWGSQVLASKVDTGSRGRGSVKDSRKRKADAISGESPKEAVSPLIKQATAASSGFIHVLPPTPENWTTSLPHRTQVVYTPDYSYILQRIRARPGSRILEAGSGSGSFTHAAARAVYQGHKSSLKPDIAASSREGAVFTFEFHEERHSKVLAEMHEHGLSSLVTATHRDVYKDGFWIKSEEGQHVFPQADCIFLDLPAPWEALQHVSREGTPEKPSVLNPESPVYLCTFSPCIEQVQKTISEMRKRGWLEIEMVEIQHKRIDVKREYTGLKYEGMRGVNAMAASVEEATARLREVEESARKHSGDTGKTSKNKKKEDANKQLSAMQLHWEEGSLIHRSEPELKTHTSYLVFAVLPREWSEEEEARTRSATSKEPAQHLHKSQKQLKKESKNKKSFPNGNAGSLDSDAAAIVSAKDV